MSSWIASSFLRAAPALVVLAMAGPVWAQSSATDKALAETLFRDGKRLFDEGKLDEACAKLQESQRIEPRLGTLLNLATCHEKQGKTASAWAEFTEAASLAAAAKQAQRAAFARTHAADLDKRLSRLTLTLEGPASGVALTLDGKPLSVAAIGSPIPVDPGLLKLEASAPGKQPWSEVVTIPAGPSLKAITIPALEALPQPPASPAPPPPPPSGMSAQRIAGIGVAGAGVVGLVVGSIFGARVFAQKGTIDAHCQGAVCDRTGLDADATAHSSATVSTIAFTAGLTCLAGGAVLFFTAPSSRPPATSLRIAPTFSASGAGLSIGGAL